MLDIEKEGNQVVEHEGSKVLLVGQELTEVLERVTIDCQETDERARLVISGQNPESKQKDCNISSRTLSLKILIYIGGGVFAGTHSTKYRGLPNN